jgi:uncharacterized protein YndB with AHSA1/START domain/dihydrofolate reductase
MSNKHRPAASGTTRPREVIERTYRARVEELWQLWTTKEGFESWWGPEGFRVKVRTLNGRPGGALHYDMIADTPEMIAVMKQMGRPSSHETRARFSEFTPHQRLAITHVIDFLPGVEPYESTVVAEFFPVGDSVRVLVTLEPMHDEEFTRMSRMGFTSQLAKLDKKFTGSHEGVTKREFIADLFISLDGFASGVNEAPFFGYFGDDLGKWVHDHLNLGQILVMGRVTYEALARFTPSATDEMSRRMTELPKLVFSSTLKEPLSWKNTRLVATSAADEIRALKQKPGDPLRSIGSVSLVKSMMQLGLVDRLRLMVFPLVLGAGGREPIYAGYSRTGFELVDHKVLDSRIVLLEYRPVPSTDDLCDSSTGRKSIQLTTRASADR